jgi:excisionase family DNA binding protein
MKLLLLYYSLFGIVLSDMDAIMITTKKAAEILGVSPRRVTALITAGKLPAQKLGRDWLINKKDLDKVKERKPGRPKKNL